MQNPKDQQVYAGFWLRFLAYMIDLFIVGLVVWLAGYTIEGIGQLSESSIWRRDLIFTYGLPDLCRALVYCVYFIIMTYLTGATIGKLLLHLKVVPVNKEKLSLLQTIYRETIGRYISSFLCLGYLVAAADRKKQGFHDMLSDTFVIQTDRKPVKKAVPRKSGAPAQKSVKPVPPEKGAPVYGTYPGQPYNQTYYPYPAGGTYLYPPMPGAPVPPQNTYTQTPAAYGMPQQFQRTYPPMQGQGYPVYPNQMPMQGAAPVNPAMYPYINRPVQPAPPVYPGQPVPTVKQEQKETEETRNESQGL